MNELPASETDTPRQPIASATLYVTLSRHFGNSVNYNAQTRELDIRSTAEGYVWNTESRFQWKRCSVTFRRDTSDSLTGFALEHGLQGVCGGIEVAAGLVAETFEDEGEEVALSPINIFFVLDNAVYTHTEELLRSCMGNGEEVSLSLDFSHRDFFRRFILGLDDVDLATKVTYPVISFSVGRRRRSNKKVMVPAYTRDATTATGLTFTASAATIQTSVWHSDFIIYQLSLTGTLRCDKLGINSVEETIEIKEYEQAEGWQNGYPEEAFPGIVSVSKDETRTYCWLDLYATRDALTQLATLLSGMLKGDVVRFDVSMIAEGLPLTAGESKSFNVTGYTPVLLKHYS